MLERACQHYYTSRTIDLSLHGTAWKRRAFSAASAMRLRRASGGPPLVIVQCVSTASQWRTLVSAAAGGVAQADFSSVRKESRKISNSRLGRNSRVVSKMSDIASSVRNTSRMDLTSSFANSRQVRIRSNLKAGHIKNLTVFNTYFT